MPDKNFFFNERYRKMQFSWRIEVKYVINVEVYTLIYISCVIVYKAEFTWFGRFTEEIAN